MEYKFIKFDDELVCLSKVGGLKVLTGIENGADLFSVVLIDLNDKILKNFISTRDREQAKRVFKEIAEKLGYIEI